MTESTPKDKSEEKDKKAEDKKAEKAAKKADAKDAAPKAKRQLPKFVVPLGATLRSAAPRAARAGLSPARRP